MTATSEKRMSFLMDVSAPVETVEGSNLSSLWRDKSRATKPEARFEKGRHTLSSEGEQILGH
jgi:hypothetical protein